MAATLVTVRLSQLKRGRIFWLDGKRGKLLYVNSCRARVRLAPKQVRIGARSFLRVVETDWTPSTEVLVAMR